MPSHIGDDDTISVSIHGNKGHAQEGKGIAMLSSLIIISSPAIRTQ